VPHALKIESEGHNGLIHQGLTQTEDNLIVHAAAVQRMRMANYYCREIGFSVRYMQPAFQEKIITFKSDFSGFDLSSPVLISDFVYQLGIT
jgi:hypothetical protein